MEQMTENNAVDGYKEMDNDAVKNNINSYRIELSIFDWHVLLQQLERLHCIINYDRTSSIDLWEKISTQLRGTEVILCGSDKHKQFEPESYAKYHGLEKKTNPELDTDTHEENNKTFIRKIQDKLNNFFGDLG